MQSSSLKTNVFGVLLSGHFSNALKRIITGQTKTEEVIILRWAIPGLFFLYFRLFYFNVQLPMLGFELRSLALEATAQPT